MSKFCRSSSIALVFALGVSSCSKPQQKSEPEHDSGSVAAAPTNSKANASTLSCDWKDGDTSKNSKFIIDRDANRIDATVADGLPHQLMVDGTTVTARISNDEYELKYDIPKNSDGHHESRDFRIDRHSRAFEIDFVDYSETPPLSYSVNGTCQDVTGQTPAL